MTLINLSGANKLPHWTEHPPTAQPPAGVLDPAQLAFNGIFEGTHTNPVTAAREYVELDQRPLHEI